jgi:MFS family permease
VQHRSRTVVGASAALAIGLVPLFLLGALSVRIGDELGFGPAATGAAIAVFFVAAGVTAVPVGWVTGRLGPGTAMRTGVAMSGASGLAIAGLVQSWGQLAAVLVVAGTAIAFVDTGAAASFAAGVRPDRRGRAFGVKEASVPAASMLAGLSIPLLADPLGWRATFVAGALLAPVAWLLAPSPVRVRPDTRAATPTDPGISWGPLVLFAVGLALGTGAATSAATFLVPAFTDAGWTAGDAGVVLAAASAASIAARLLLGRLVDRRPTGSRVAMGVAMAVGSLGAATLASGTVGAVGVLAAVVLLGAGWGWTGVAFHVALSTTEEAPGVVAGVVLSGLSLGGAFGPAAFGALSARTSFTGAWAAVSGGLLAAAVVTAWAGSASASRLASQ